MYCLGKAQNIDHIVPRSRGMWPDLNTGYGANHWTNLAPCCWNCNTKKLSGSLFVWGHRKGKMRSPEIILKYFVRRFGEGGTVHVEESVPFQKSSSTTAENVEGR